MKTNSILKNVITIILVSLLLTSCGGKEAENNDSSTGTKQDQISQTTKSDEINDENLSLLEQFYNKKIGSLRCDTHTQEEDGFVDQTIYLSGEKMRMDIIVTNNNNTKIENHLISDEQYSYTWGPQGAYKMKINDDSMDEDIDTDNVNININRNENEYTDYEDYSADVDEALEEMSDTNCKKWDVDNSVFKVPSGIVFQDMEQMLQELENNLQNIDMQQFQNMMQNNMQ